MSFQYDPLGRITQSTQTTDTNPYNFTYTHDLADHLRSQTYPSGRVVTIGYDSAGRLNVITGHKLNEPDKTYASQFSYAAHGAIAGVKLGNELWEYALFNGRMQPYESGLGSYGGNSSLFKLEYEYVKNGFPATTNNGNMTLERITAPDPGGIPKCKHSCKTDPVASMKN